ncbi:hypothetical protein PS008_25105, partial [Shigella sonnei]|nr:hypothetical protein [Shigella sonnei]
STRVANGGCQWRFVVAYRDGRKLIVTGEGAGVGLKGGLLHTVQVGGKCVQGGVCEAGDEKGGG